MRKAAALLLAVCLCLLAACAGGSDHKINSEDPLDGRNTIQPADYEEPDYRFDDMTAEEQFKAEDGAVLMQYSYQLLTLSVSNLENLSPEDRERAEENAETFNDRMIQLMDESVARGRDLGSEAQGLYEMGSAVYEYTDTTTAGGRLCGQIVSIYINTYSYSGGAHGAEYTDGYIFDLSVGRFIDPIQIADDPEMFRVGAADKLIEKADAIEENRDSYWSNYQEIISRWNEGTVLFDGEGMTVVYSAYELGPYAMGAVELRLSYEELADLLGPGGLEHLGAAQQDAEN